MKVKLWSQQIAGLQLSLFYAMLEKKQEGSKETFVTIRTLVAVFFCLGFDKVKIIKFNVKHQLLTATFHKIISYENNLNSIFCC